MLYQVGNGDDRQGFFQFYKWQINNTNKWWNRNV